MCSLKTDKNDLSYYQRNYYQTTHSPNHENSPTMHSRTMYEPSISTPSSSSFIPKRMFKVGFLPGRQSSAAISEKEILTTFQNWRKSTHDTNNQPDDSSLDNSILSPVYSSSSSKRSSSDITRVVKKRRTNQDEGALFGPIPTITSYNDDESCDKEDNVLLEDETILQELERITNNDNDDTLYPFSPPASPLLSFSTFEEMNDDFVLFP